MKPDIDLNNDVVKKGIEHFGGQVEKALNAPQSVEKAVIPLYAIPKTKGHQKPKTKPEQTGSGVLVNIKSEYFIFGATHVFLEYNGFQILLGAEHGAPVQSLMGERLSTGNPKSPLLDKYDASVFRIQSEIPDSIKRRAINLSDFDFGGNADEKSIFMAAGYRIKKSNTSGNSVRSKIECFPSVEVDQTFYTEVQVDSRAHLIMPWEKQYLTESGWKTSPTPRGLSGGAIIKVVGTDVSNHTNNGKTARQLLSAIITEHHNQKGSRVGYLMATRISVHLGLIHGDMPDLLNDILGTNMGKK